MGTTDFILRCIQNVPCWLHLSGFTRMLPACSQIRTLHGAGFLQNSDFGAAPDSGGCLGEKAGFVFLVQNPWAANSPSAAGSSCLLPLFCGNPCCEQCGTSSRPAPALGAAGISQVPVSQWVRHAGLPFPHNGQAAPTLHLLLCQPVTHNQGLLDA